MRFRDALAAPGLGAIAEIKRRSPSAGELRGDADPALLARQFAQAGAAALSVLVDARFGGTLDDLRAARAATELPILGKGFFTEETDLAELKAAGADAALILLRDVDDTRARALLAEARRLGLDALVEAHDAEELERAIALEAEIVGVNARDLGSFAIDRRKQLELVAQVPRDRVVVAESGVHTRAQGAAAELAGANAILVGTALMRAPDPGAKLAELISRPLVKVCGLTRDEDVEVAVDAGADLVGFILARETPRRAPRVLDVPDTVLSVAVFVEDVDETPADLVQLYERENGHRGKDAALLRDGQRGRTRRRPALADRGPRPPRARIVDRRSRDARGRPLAGERARRDRRGAPVGRRRELVARERAGDQGRGEGARVRRGGAMLNYGDYGGRFVPETLIPALDELEAGWRAALADDAFHAELHHLLTTYAGRPTPLTLADRFAPGKRLYLKREDLLHTGAHKLNNALGQAVLARRLGKQRIVAETGAGQHGVATATVCARFGFDCVVYMGAEDMRRQRPNVDRMHLLGAEVRPVEFGTKTLKEATSEAIRDWITNVETTHYLIGSCVGPHPYPELVAELQSVIGRESREQVLAAEGRLPDAVVACVGGGSNAIGIFSGFVDDEVRLIGVEAAGAASLGTGRPAVLHGARSSVLADDDGQVLDAHSISAGLDYPGVGPEHAHLRDTGRAEYVGATDDEALAAAHRLARTEGIIPALEPAHALARALELDEELVVVCLSGRGDKDLAHGLEVARVVDLPWQTEDPGHLARASSMDGRVMLAGGLSAENVRAAINAVHPWAVDASSSLESEPGIKDEAKVRAFVESARC